MNGWKLLQRLEVAAVDLFVDVRQKLHSGAAIAKVATDLLVPRFTIALDEPSEESLTLVESEFTDRGVNIAKVSHGRLPPSIAMGIPAFGSGAHFGAH
jgi:hypothetical protein